MNYDIYLHKKGQEGVSPLNPESPINENAVSPKPAISKAALLGYGSLLANRTYSTVVQEIRASGNEELATTLSNISRGGTLIAAAVATKGLSLIPEVINSTASQVVRYRSAARESRIAEYAVNLKGSRVNFNQGRVYFD
jgi:hypothetical protein